MPLKVKAANPQAKEKSEKKAPNRLLEDRANHNPFQFAQDVSYLEHCARIYGEENFRPTFQMLRPFRERLAKFMPPPQEETEFDAYDENWWTQELDGIIQDIQEAKEIVAIKTKPQDIEQPESPIPNVKNSSVLQDETEETDIFMPRQTRRRTDYTLPFSETSLRIKQLNDGRVAVIGERSKEIVKSRILGGI